MLKKVDFIHLKEIFDYVINKNDSNDDNSSNNMYDDNNFPRASSYTRLGSLPLTCFPALYPIS